MDPYAEKFHRMLVESHSPAEHLIFEQSCHSVAEAMQAVQSTAEDFVKNICLIGENDELIVAIVKGEDRVSLKKVGRALDIPTPRLATPEEILVRTGYPCGGTPSFGFSAIFLVDERVTEKEFVYTGGGSEQALMKVKTADLLQANQGRIVPIRK